MGPPLERRLERGTNASFFRTAVAPARRWGRPKKSLRRDLRSLEPLPKPTWSIVKGVDCFSPRASEQRQHHLGPHPIGKSYDPRTQLARTTIEHVQPVLGHSRAGFESRCLPQAWRRAAIVARSRKGTGGEGRGRKGWRQERRGETSEERRAWEKDPWMTNEERGAKRNRGREG
eukprot:8627000-Pyramimonas_sp.AAC.1